ncbi:MAG: peptidase M24 [Oligoflexia bacterium]|nr:MAG: peptidase M24 [Oligoflexia bacterium]
MGTDKKKVTFFIVTNDAGETKKLVLSTAWIKGGVLLGAILFFALIAGLVDYFGLLVQTAENKRLKVENTQLIKQFQAIEGKVTALETNLERVKTFTTKLKLITNIENQDRDLKLSMNPEPAPNQQIEEFDVPMEKREGLAELEKAGQDFTGQKPLDESKGELAVHENRDYQSLAIRIDRSIKDAQLREQSVLDLWETLSEKQSLMNAIPNIRPARGWLTSRFGYRMSPFTGRAALHAGLDIAAAPGSPVYAPADGVVSFAGYDEGYGKMVVIDHGYGYSTRYGHNAQIYVQVGQRLNRWDIIASVGNTGRSTGPHLHYEVRLNGVPKNPANFILDE